MGDPSPSGFRFRTKIPEGDDRARLVCEDCGYVAYSNPKIVVGAVCTWQDRLLLCRRAIEPRKGCWTFPAGYLEEGETTEQGALREVKEESRADARIDALLGIYSISHISQVYLIYRAELVTPEFGATYESDEVRLFRWEEIPWGRIAFDSVDWGLRRHREVIGRAVFPPFRYPGAGSFPTKDSSEMEEKR